MSHPKINYLLTWSTVYFCKLELGNKSILYQYRDVRLCIGLDFWIQLYFDIPVGVVFACFCCHLVRCIFTRDPETSVGRMRAHVQRLCPRCSGRGFESDLWLFAPCYPPSLSLSLIPFPVTPQLTGLMKNAKIIIISKISSCIMGQKHCDIWFCP